MLTTLGTSSRRSTITKSSLTCLIHAQASAECELELPLELPAGIRQRLLTRHTARTTRHAMEVCLDGKDPRVFTRENNGVAVGTTQQLDRSSGHGLAETGNDGAMILSA